MAQTGKVIMGIIEIVRFSTWDEFKGGLNRVLFGDQVFEEARFAFRGMGDEAWRLTSTFDREAHALDVALREGAASELLGWFAEECESEETIASCSADLDERVALAQHNGLPTRALDWTESPYVAAYFAFADLDAMRGRRARGSNVAIWILEVAHPAMNGTIGARVVWPRRRGNERLMRQRGLFTILQAPYDSLDEYLENANGAAAIRKCILPRSEARNAMADLRAMGITASRLFPDTGGAARAALVRYLSRAGSP